jgi:hypothetical protein
MSISSLSHVKWSGAHKKYHVSVKKSMHKVAQIEEEKEESLSQDS